MSKSHKRVLAALDAAGVDYEMREETVLTKTAVEAAEAAGCEVDQIAKSIIWKGAATGAPLLFLTAGGRRVDEAQASALAGEALERADADYIRAATGFAIGGVSPVGHTGPVRAWMDRRLTEFSIVWAAAGTPRHNFAVSPSDLIRITGAQIAAFAS